MSHIIVFFLYFTTDWCSSRWASACTEGRAAHAGCWMLVYHTLHALAVLCIVNDPWCIIALALGGFCGTWFAINQKNQKTNCMEQWFQIAVDKRGGRRGKDWH